MNSLNTKKAFVSLFTMLLASLALAMAVGITVIALKQIVLSSTSSEANKAFFAADSAVECVLNYDILQNNPINASCFGGQNIDVDTVAGFSIFSDSGSSDGLVNVEAQGSCVRMELTKDINDFFEDWDSQIEARGYNFPCDQIFTNPRRVERAIRVRY